MSRWRSPWRSLLAVPARRRRRDQDGPGRSLGPAAKDFQDAFGDANQFFRRTVTIHKGDSVTLEDQRLPQRDCSRQGGVEAPALIVPDPASLVSRRAATRRAPRSGSTASRTSASTRSSRSSRAAGRSTRTRRCNSGLPLAEGPPPPYKLKFKQTGRFSYLCIVHPGMAGTVKVVKHRAARSRRRATDKRAARRELARTLRRSKRLTTGTGWNARQARSRRATTGAAARPCSSSSRPTRRSRSATTVTLQMPPRTTEVHTFTLRADQRQGRVRRPDRRRTCSGAVFDPRGFYPSEPPPASAGPTPARTTATATTTPGSSTATADRRCPRAHR